MANNGNRKPASHPAFQNATQELLYWYIRNHIPDNASGEPIGVDTMASHLGIDRSLVSRHLRVLLDNGLISRRHVGRNAFAYTYSPLPRQAGNTERFI